LKGKLVPSIFWATVACFILIVLGMSGLLRSFGGGYLLFSIWIIFTGLGITLTVLTVKKKVVGKLKVYLLLAGASATGFLVFIVLHNLVYALFSHFFGENFWGTGGDEPVFFVLAIIVCPLGFLIGAVGTIILGLKNKSNANQIIEGGKP
jgi:hypothetical protein